VTAIPPLHVPARPVRVLEAGRAGPELLDAVHSAAVARREVSRQLVRNREAFGVSWEDTPVFGTSAARFDGDGVTALYPYLRDTLGYLRDALADKGPRSATLRPRSAAGRRRIWRRAALHHGEFASACGAADRTPCTGHAIHRVTAVAYLRPCGDLLRLRGALSAPRRNGSYVVEQLTDLVDDAVLAEFERISEHGGGLGAMETARMPGDGAVEPRCNVFGVLVGAVRVCPLGQITEVLFEVGGQYRRKSEPVQARS
jgi:hypothetical protein